MKLNWLVYHIHDRELAQQAKTYFSGRLIDIGCGCKPYVNLISPYVSEHVGLDHDGTEHDKVNIDLFGTAYSIPTGNDEFDSALCSAVLEHLEEPEAALSECRRVLKSGGVAIYSVPFIWHLHEEPRDFYRFTKYGLKYLFEKTGFEVIRIIPLSGFWVTFGQLLVYNIYRFHCGALRYIPVIPIACMIIQGISYLLDRIDKNERWTWMYMVVARKL